MYPVHHSRSSYLPSRRNPSIKRFVDSHNHSYALLAFVDVPGVDRRPDIEAVSNKWGMVISMAKKLAMKNGSELLWYEVWIYHNESGKRERRVKFEKDGGFVKTTILAEEGESN